MKKTIIYHNPRCSKSREALQFLKDHNCETEIMEYLKTPPSEEQLESLLDLLNIQPEELIRKNESIYAELYKGKKLSDKQWIKAMAEHPQLIERPIIIHDGKAVIGRPVEKVIELFR